MIDQVNIGPSPELYASLVSDKAAPVNSDKRDKRPRGFGMLCFVDTMLCSVCIWYAIFCRYDALFRVYLICYVL